mmetsp:Transcript_125916/g.350828  ORF Transcript_125916/g.350828 Transcript_125916/m.350828 type:complete len:164 (-) Transcript_125916:105-596(-)
MAVLDATPEAAAHATWGRLGPGLPRGRAGRAPEPQEADEDLEDPLKRFGDKPLTCAQKCGIAVLCGALMVYFIPMLCFIPLALFGGLHFPKPHGPGYNPLSNETAVRESMPYSETRSDIWYWDLHTDFLLVLGMPVAVLGSAYLLKMCLAAPASGASKSAHSL